MFIWRVVRSVSKIGVAVLKTMPYFLVGYSNVSVALKWTHDQSYIRDDLPEDGSLRQVEMQLFYDVFPSLTQDPRPLRYTRKFVVVQNCRHLFGVLWVLTAVETSK